MAFNSVSKEIAASIIFIETTEEMWNDLKDLFSQGNRSRIFQLRTYIASLSQDNTSVCTYYTQMKGFWDELLNYQSIPACSCGTACASLKIFLQHQHEEYVMWFLVGLNQKYSHVWSQILLMNPLPKINKVFALVLQEEQ